MIKNRVGKTENSFNEYKGSSGASDTEMSSMYDIPSDLSDITLEKKDKSVANKDTVRILNDNMSSMYNMLKNK